MENNLVISLLEFQKFQFMNNIIKLDWKHGVMIFLYV